MSNKNTKNAQSNIIENDRYIFISPSFLSSDFTRVSDSILHLERARADFIHCDVMDGSFVPKITFGCKMISDIKSITREHEFLKLDVHLMINNPIKHIKQFADAGADIITVHYESTSNHLGGATASVDELYTEIKKHSKLAGLSIKPKTPVSVIEKYVGLFDLILIMSVEPGEGGQAFIEDSIDKIKHVRRLIDATQIKQNKHIFLQVDGGINFKTAPLVIEAG
ncbi:MAG: ribulose-phosphate 3-epimerase, partial [Firmicutes bacterium]|nr:ribulose-phosphate 3-epimerase [Bacillota bacterium]